MGMFTRLFGGEAGRMERVARAARLANLSVPNVGEAAHAEAIPGQVDVEFHLHDRIDELNGNYLTALTSGLVASGQRELALSMRLADAENPLAKMQEVVRFVQTVHAWAQNKSFLQEGGFTQFGDRGLFGKAHSGVLYVAARPVPGIDVPKNTLAAVFVDPLEIRTAMDFGVYRVLTRIGLQLRLFPFPTWGALDRPSAMTKREGQTRLAKVSRLRTPGVTLLMSEGRLSVTLPNDDSLAKGFASLSEQSSFALLTRPAPEANAILVFKPGLEEALGISPDGSDRSRISGSSLVVSSGSATDEVRQSEDGYALSLTRESLALFRRAVGEGRALELDLEGGLRLSLVV